MICLPERRWRAWGEEQRLGDFWMVYPMVKPDESPWLGYLGFGYPRLSTVRGRQVEKPCRQHPVQPQESRKMRSLRNRGAALERGRGGL